MTKFNAFVVIATIFDLARALDGYCNPLLCLSSVNALFKSDRGKNVCSKFKDVQDCVNVCSPLFSENVQDLKDGFQRLTDKVCKDENLRHHSNFWHKKCIERRKFQMLTCIYEAWSLVLDEETLKDKSIFYCRKMMEVEKCPSDVYMCKDETISYMEHLLIKFFGPIQEELCFGHTLEDVWSLNAQHVPKMDEYKSLSKCLDVNFKHMMSCVPDNWISNFAYNDYQHEQLCNAFDVFLDCVNVTIDKKCGADVLKSFLPMNEMIHQVFHEQCSNITSQISSTTENIASRMVLTPHTPEKMGLSQKFVGDNLTSGSHNDRETDLYPHYIVVHFDSFEFSGSGHKESTSVILVILLFVSVLEVL